MTMAETNQAPQADIAGRLARLRKALAERDLDGIFVSRAENRRYLSGFTGSAGWLLITHDEALLMTDFRYWEQSRLEAPDFELVKVVDRLDDVLPGVVERFEGKRIAFEAAAITVDEHQRWMAANDAVTWVAETNLVEEIRAVKDEAEIGLIREAARIADAALAAALAEVRPGMLERDLAWLLERRMREQGADGPAFDIIVAGGASGALPHAHARRAPLPAGQPIVIDMGAVVDGYRSDMTRTICLGEPADPNSFWTVYNTVLKAQQAALEGIRAGMAGPEADALARDVIQRAGYGEEFGHSLGHGVGLAIHEEPRLGRRSTTVLQPGMVVTIEPGIYLPGWGGVRIEDLVVVREDGLEVLTSSSKNPLIFGEW
ncbi:MAG: aminopeptidase P family protein [Anaerolineae bacterium]